MEDLPDVTCLAPKAGILLPELVARALPWGNIFRPYRAIKFKQHPL